MSVRAKFRTPVLNNCQLLSSKVRMELNACYFMSLRLAGSSQYYDSPNNNLDGNHRVQCLQFQGLDSMMSLIAANVRTRQGPASSILHIMENHPKCYIGSYAWISLNPDAFGCGSIAALD